MNIASVLKRELPQWVDDGLVEQSQADALSERYGLDDDSTAGLVLPAIDVPPLMYPHPELGCGGKLRFDDHRCRWPITQCAVRSMVIVVSSPQGGQCLGFLDG